DIDKNLINAKTLFSNLKDLDDLKDDFSHLTDNQKEALIRRFNENFEGDTRLKTAFRSVWNILGEVYAKFKEKLFAEKIAYSGMMMREAIENEHLELTGAHYAFVGFNALNRCEEKLFKHLKNKALFYWDYDPYYLKTPAGRFIKENILKFGSALPEPPSDGFIKNKNIKFLASPSESGQSGAVPKWLDSLGKPAAEINSESAIVLCNERLLPVVMHSISSEKVENANITMGFPVMQTPIAGFITLLGELQTIGLASGRAFRYRYVLQILRHNYAGIIFPEAEIREKEIVKNNIFFPDEHFLRCGLLFRHTENTVDLCRYLLEITEEIGKSFHSSDEETDIYEDLYRESVFKAYQLLNRLYGLLSNEIAGIEKMTFLKLLKKLLATTQIPFHGEPVKGLQIMGVLETRTLDFKNLLVLSANEGIMPANNADNTFIPQFLRAGLGLSTVDYQDSIYAYYFFRLIQRAENITLVYSVDKNGLGKAEMSRFMLKMLVDPNLEIHRYSLQSEIIIPTAEALTIPKSDELMQIIREKYDLNTNRDAHSLSPTSINTYIDCPLQFYLRKIKGIESPEEMSDEMDASVMGSIFHSAAEALYRGFGTNITQDKIEEYLKNGADFKIEILVSQAFEKHFFKRKNVDRKQYNGEQLIQFKVICKMLKNLLKYDSERAPIEIKGLEQSFYDIFDLPVSGAKIRVGGVIDRLEAHKGSLMVVDYKTGGSAKSVGAMEELFVQKKDRANYVFQTFLYSTILLRKKFSELPVKPALFYMQKLGMDDFSPEISFNKSAVDDFRLLAQEFQTVFLQKIEELFDPQTPFCQTDVEQTCSYCDFKNYCRK
ncbi:MAG: PD-(D/E)XK nuclease family protein, partial [Dysgonamonadaceae bacterium]|nr:PD-(D/E)XK nuclease family protein [Dysgonamonadaceae bacterium]